MPDEPRDLMADLRESLGMPRYSTTGHCTACHGSGVIDESPGPVTECEACHGTGRRADA